MRFIFLWGGISLVGALLLPEAAAAQSGLVTCTGLDCNACSLVSLVNNLVQWIIGFLVLVAVVLLVIAGFGLVTSGGDTGALEKAKNTFVSVVIGFIIILASWLIVDTILQGLTGRGLNALGPVTCGGMVEPVTPTETRDPYDLEGPESVRDLPAAASDGCPTCVDISDVVACKNPRSCTVEGEYGERLAGLIANVDRNGLTMEVTEGFPPTRTHRAACHGDGTCVDIVFKDREWTSERVRSFQAQAEALGFRAVYEPGKGESCLGSSNCVTGVATGNHFSLYFDGD